MSPIIAFRDTPARISSTIIVISFFYDEFFYFLIKKSLLFINIIKEWEKNLELLNKLVDLISELNICFRYIAIDKKYFKTNLQQRVSNYIKIDPYIYDFRILYQYMSEHLQKNNEKGIIFLDEILRF